MAFSKREFDVARLWLAPANDEPMEPSWRPLRLIKRKACRKGVKAELRSLALAVTTKDNLRRAWIAGRCEVCARCPKLVAKLST